MMTLVSTITVGSGGASSIEFTGIPGTGKDLLVLFSLRDSHASVGVVQATFNNTAFGTTARAVIGNGSTVSSINSDPLTLGQIPNSSFTANTFGSGSMHVSNYAGSTAKSLSIETVTENNATASEQRITARRNPDTNPVTIIRLDPFSSFVQHSTASLYIVS